VSAELDQIVATALARDPRQRWQSAKAMGDRIRALVAQPGNAMDNKGVIDWVDWAFEQRRGRAPQLTPMMAMPIRTSSDPTSEFVDIDGATAISPRAPAWYLSVPRLWLACGGALFLLLVIVVVVKLFS
jgi:hypothetical protein